MNVELFSVFTPWGEIDLEKAEREQAEGKGRIRGIMSSQTKDHIGEEVVQAGVDWSYFEKHGYFNWEHQPGPENVLGYPEKVIKGLTDDNGNPATGVEGYLLLNRPKAREAWELALELQKSGSTRRPGFSIEGQTLARDPSNPKRITRSRVINVTITAHPMQPDSRFEALARSLSAAEAAGVAAAGYQEPAGTSGGDAGNLAPLVPQDMGKNKVTKTHGKGDEEAIYRAMEAAMAQLAKDFPNAPRAKLASIAASLLRV